MLKKCYIFSRSVFPAAFFIVFLSLGQLHAQSIPLERKGQQTRFRKEPWPIYASPVVWWNNYNKAMIGIALHKQLVKRHRFEYVLAPLFSFNPAGFAFYGQGKWQIPLRSNWAESIENKFGYTRFSYDFDTEARYWNKIYLRSVLYIKNRQQKKNVPKFGVGIRSIFQVLESNAAYLNLFQRKNISYNVSELFLQVRSQEEKNRYQALLMLESINELGKYPNSSFSPGHAVKLSLEWKQRIHYFSLRKGLDVRFFAGTFLSQSQTLLDYRYRMSSYGGSWDYKFDDYYFGRKDASGITSRQLYEYDAGFKVLTPLGQTNKWILSLNIKASLPGPIPIKPFFDMALHRQVLTVVNTGEVQKSTPFSYSGGIMLSLIDDVFEVYFPLFHSKDIREYLAFSGQKWHQQIRFTLNIAQLDKKNIKNQMGWLPPSVFKKRR